MRGWFRFCTVLAGIALVLGLGGYAVFRLDGRSAAHSKSPATTGPRPTHVNGPGTVQTLQLPASDAAGGKRVVWVYRPDVPDSAGLPVLYLLHGLPGDAVSMATALNLQLVLNQAFTTGTLAPFVVAVPDGNSTGADDPEWADAKNGTVRLDSFVSGELIRAVEGLHRRDREHRAIAGFSMGGYGAMNLALRHADRYGQAVALAGYFHVDDPSGVFGGDPALEAANSPDRHVPAAARLRIMLAQGTDDQEEVVSGETQRFAELLRTAGQHPLVDLRPGDHTWDWVSSMLPTMFSFLEQGWPA